MSLVTLAYVKQYFPLYNKYFLDEEGEPDDVVLQDEIDLAEAEFGEYVSVDADTITSSLKRHILNIVKYRGFNRLHGDTEFESKPQIVRDYEATIAKLQAFKNATQSTTGTDPADANIVTYSSKTRLFDEWFNDEEET